MRIVRSSTDRRRNTARASPAQSRGDDEVMRMSDAEKDDRPIVRRLRLVRLIGPGLITGASDEDPSGSVYSSSLSVRPRLGEARLYGAHQNRARHAEGRSVRRRLTRAAPSANWNFSPPFSRVTAVSSTKSPHSFWPDPRQVRNVPESYPRVALAAH
jgi:hypothetical protein